MAIRKQRTQGRLRRTKTKPEEVRESDAAFFRKLDKRVLDLSVEYGSDNSEPHEMSFWMYLPSEDAAYKLAGQLQTENFAVDVSPPLEGRRDWLCLAYLTMVPDQDQLERIRRQLTRLVKSFGGKYDGWEMEVKP